MAPPQGDSEQFGSRSESPRSRQVGHGRQPNRARWGVARVYDVRRVRHGARNGNRRGRRGCLCDI